MRYQATDFPHILHYAAYCNVGIFEIAGRTTNYSARMYNETDLAKCALSMVAIGEAATHAD
jgi:hypothetical protein